MIPKCITLPARRQTSFLPRGGAPPNPSAGRPGPRYARRGKRLAMDVGGVDVRWAPKLRPEKLRRLYELDAQGLADEELIDEVGYTLYSRCESILTVTESFRGRVPCPGCGAVVLREPGTGPQEEMLCC